MHVILSTLATALLSSATAQSSLTCKNQYLHCPLSFSKCKVSKTYQPQTGGVELQPSWFEGVYAAADGKVKHKRDGQKSIVLEHNDGGRTFYAKLGAVRTGLQVGDRVKRGDLLGITYFVSPVFFQYLTSDWKFHDPVPCFTLNYGLDDECGEKKIPCPLSGDCKVISSFSPQDNRNGVQLNIEANPTEVYAVSSGIVNYIDMELWDDEQWNYFHIRVNHPGGDSVIYHDLILPDIELFGEWYNSENGEDVIVEKGDVVGYTNPEHPFTFEYIPNGQLLQIDPEGCFADGPGSDTVGTEGGEVVLDRVGAISFPDDAFTKQTSVEIKKTNRDSTDSKFKEVSSLFRAKKRLSYEVEVMLNQLPDISGHDPMMALELPPSIHSYVPEGHRLEVFALVEQNDFNIDLGSRDEKAKAFVMFDSSIVDTYDNSRIVFALPRAAFFSNPGASGNGFKAVITVASTPGTTSRAISNNQIRERHRYLSSRRCKAASIRCPVASGCRVITPFSAIDTPTSLVHYGIDLDAGLNEQILAAADGTVEFAGTKDDFGNTLVIRHKDGSATMYSHLGQRTKKVGDSVIQGDLIGRAWNGNDPHFPLHFEYVPNGELYTSKSHIDPEPCVGGVDGSVEVGDNGKIADDVFGISIDGLYIGTTAIGATSTLAVNGLLPGKHKLEITVWLALDGKGTYFIRLRDGITFEDGSMYKKGIEPMFSSRTYTIIVPEPEDSDDAVTAIPKEGWWDNTEAGMDCQEWILKDFQLPNFLPVQPPCPCRQLPPGRNVEAADGFQALKLANQDYHPGANHCIRSDESFFASRSSGQQCCYDASGDLITGGLAAGSPDRYAPYSGPSTGFFGHMIWDVIPAENCPCSTYLALRTPDNANGCKKNVVNAC